MKTQILKTIQQMKEFRNNLSLKSVGFVPTMGSLHEGHLELIKNSLKNNDVTIVSIFVNPMQFNNPKDYDTYPNHMMADLELLESLNVDAVFLPDKDQIYPNGYDFKLMESKDSLDLCGSARPGHFDGVLTVLLKLFHLVKPKDVYMGIKDYQQFRLVKNMTKDFFMDIEVHGIETIREASGLAMSSRNLNLKPDDKITAELFAEIFSKDQDLSVTKSELEALGQNSDFKIDYLIEKWDRKFVAAFVGGVRLIDNRPYIMNSNLKNHSNKNLNQTKFEKTVKLNSTQNINNTIENTKSEPNDLLNTKSSKNILFKMSGSIACYKACDVISKLVQLGHSVKVAVTPDTFNFVGQATLEGLTQNQVISDLYTPGQMMDHIHLNDWCDLAVLCPATANTISKISIGMSDNIVTALALSRDTSKPYLMMPAMNTRMLVSKPIQDAFAKLEKMNIKLLYGDAGHLACGHTGSGRLAEPSEILDFIIKIVSTELNEKNLKPNLDLKFNSLSNSQMNLSNTIDFNPTIAKTKKLKILVTAGGTSEPIDPVRTVTNISSGQTGLNIVQYLADKFDVTLLGANSMKDKMMNLKPSFKYIGFSSFKDLETKMKDLLAKQDFDVVIHLAAVSDYSPRTLSLSDQTIELPALEKISLDNKAEVNLIGSFSEKFNSTENINIKIDSIKDSGFSIEFVKNKKLINEIRTISKNKDIKIIGFKLIRTDDLEKIQFEIDKVLKSSDFVVVNDLENISDTKHIYEIYNHEGLVFHGETKNDMSQDLLKIIERSDFL